MRMWGVDPTKLCRKHLLGEHVEMHMFSGCLRRGLSVKGYVDQGLVEIHKVRERHDLLAAEMVRRGYRHVSPLLPFPIHQAGTVDVEANERELKRRCDECFGGGIDGTQKAV